MNAKDFQSFVRRIRSYRRNRGIAVLWAAATLFMLILFMGIAVDGARVYFAANQLQNAADAAALAGARVVRIDQDAARQQAKYIGGLNYCFNNSVALELNSENLPQGDIVAGKFFYDERGFVPLQDMPSGMPPDSLKVITKRTSTEHGALPLFFGPIVKVNTADVSRVAIAQAIGGWGAGIIVLNCTAEPSLRVSGTSDVTVIGGGVQVNAFRVDGDPAISATEINVNGGAKGLSDDIMQYTNLGAPPMPDPLCPGSQCDGSVAAGGCLPTPDFGTLQDNKKVVVKSGETKVLQPGYYPGGIEITTKTGTATLQPGIYVLDGVGLNINGGNLIGDGVMFYITGTGKVDLRGNGNIQLNQNFEIESGPFTGMAIYQDRTNANTATIIGTDNMDINGTLYFPRNHVELGGQGDGFGTQLIADTLNVHGTGLLQINYDGRNPYPTNKSILVF